MLTGASPSPNADFSTALPQPILGLNTKIQAMAISSPGTANDNSDSVWKSAAPGASVRSTAQATNAPMTKVVTAVPSANTKEFQNNRRICQLE